MELLSPAGNITNAYSALKAGADAIYIGGKRFSARASAENFSDEEIKQIVTFAHSIDRKVFVTLNTLLYQDEFFEAVEFAKFLYETGIDGLIVQDLGLAHYLHQTMPNLPLHASTQLNCHNVRQAEALIKVGFKRIVLAREININTAKKIKELGVEIEVFGHGALCVSYSGNCLMSSFIGDRSGNRGKCAQPCRMRYDLLENGQTIEESTFLLSTKDLMTIDYLADFIELGIESLKIEGRLKSNEYIYAVTKAYRHAIDAAENDKINNNLHIDKQKMIKIFNRQFTRGYIFNESPFSLINASSSSHRGEIIGKIVSAYKNRVSIKLSKPVHRLDGIRFEGKEEFGLTIEKMFINKVPVEEAKEGQVIELSGIDFAEKFAERNVIRSKDYLLSKEIEDDLRNNVKLQLKGKFIARVGENICLTIAYKNHVVNVTGDIAQIAQNEGTTKQRIKDQLSKSGSFPYVISELEEDIEKCFIPVSSLNALRNQAFEKLALEMNKTYYPEYKEYQNTHKIVENVPKYCLFAEFLETDLTKFATNFKVFSRGSSAYNFNNRTMNDIYLKARNELLHFPVINNENKYLIASQYCNITNSYALDCYQELGFSEFIISLEADFDSISSLISDYKQRNDAYPNVGLVVYGKYDMMIMKSCPINTHYQGKSIHCGKCHSKNFTIKDRIGEPYRIIGDEECNTIILSNKPLYLLDKIEELSLIGVNNYYYNFTDESKEKIEDILSNSSSFNKNNYTRGHYNKRPL